MKILVLDPGSKQTGWMIFDTDTRLPIKFDITQNTDMRKVVFEPLANEYEKLFIEFPVPRGESVKWQTIYEVYWAGRFRQMAGRQAVLINRMDVKVHHTGKASANDAMVNSALKERYGGEKVARGSKKEPGVLYGVKADIWAALAIGLYVADCWKAGKPHKTVKDFIIRIEKKMAEGRAKRKREKELRDSAAAEAAAHESAAHEARGDKNADKD